METRRRAPGGDVEAGAERGVKGAGRALRWLALVIPEAIGTDWQWYRRALGGHWERWYVDHPVCADLWHRCPLGCTKHTLRRPSGLCRGTPTCEDWS